MSKRTVAVVLILVGVAILVVSIAADVLGIGNAPGFGWKQILGTVVGGATALAGIWLMVNKPDQRK
jgi:hypothetical protein